MKKQFLYIKRDTTKWSILLLAIILFVSIPVLTIFFKVFNGPGETWGHLVENLLADYLVNSLFLIVGCSLLALFFGISSAWIISRYTIPFRKQLEWLLILPLALPSYMTAYAYAGIFDYGGVVEKSLVLSSKVDIMNIQGLIFVLSISLYPYIYVSSRAFFANQSYSIIETSKLLGAGETRTFFRLILPIARPAIVGGLILVLMEVLNDYGAAKYFGINTFTTGIFRAWFSLEEPETAVYLSGLLISLVFGLIVLEKWQRRKKSYANTVKNHIPLKRITTGKSLRFLLFLIVLTPVLLGFVFPVLQLVYWAFLTYRNVLDTTFIATALQSLILASLAALLTVLFALFLIFLSRWNRLQLLKPLTKISILGYAIPGAVIAIGILIPSLAIDKWFITFFKNHFNTKTGFILNGTILALLYAYMVRFLAVAYNPIEAGSLKNGKSLAEASGILGKTNFKTFFKVDFPLLKPAIVSGFILVFVDVMKELPLTLILKPYSINTLAVKAYEFASDELITEAALPSLFVILTGVVPVLFLNRMINKNDNK